MQSTRLYTILLVSFLFPAALSAQVFDSGPSDPALFTSVVELPGDVLPAADAMGVVTVGGVAGDTIQVNFDTDGSLTAEFLDAQAGSEINIDGGVVGNQFRALAGSEVNVINGIVGDFFASPDGAAVNIGGGSVGDFVRLIDGNLNITGGTVGDFLFVDTSIVNISGGSVGDFFEARNGNEVNISGGSVGTDILISGNSVINISGGSIGPGFIGEDGSTVNLSGSEFVLDGVLMDNLTEGEAFIILDRDVALSGVLEDGSAISLDLISAPIVSVGGFTPGATLTVTLVPELEFLLGDVNRDGEVDFSDIAPFIAVLAAGDDQAEADINGDNTVDFSDISAFISLLSS